MEEYLGIENILQKDNHTFVIKWHNGVYNEYRLSTLQRHCPCSRCQKENPSVQEEVVARRIYSIGRYSLKIEFATGCSYGLFTYRFLWSLAHAHI